MPKGRRTSGPLALIIRDGWGENPDPAWNDANAIHLAHTPIADAIAAKYPRTLIHTSGQDVGLPDGVMGNSEVGHQNIGAGRIVEQEIMRITGRIRDGQFFQNKALIGAFEAAARSGGQVHIMGLCSDGRVHSDLDHLYGLLELAVRQRFPGDRIHVHAFTDGRDTGPNEGRRFIEQIELKCRELGINQISSVVGRFYAMDRDNRWERVEEAYRLLTEGAGQRFASADAALAGYYENPDDRNRRGDEFVRPSVTTPEGSPPACISSGDSVMFFNFRGDRPREITRAFVLDEFPYLDNEGCPQGFERSKPDVRFVAMTEYEKGLPVDVAFTKPPKMEQILGAYLSELGLRQFRCAETEKYPHVTFFFNDYRDDPFDGEERQIVPSPRDISTYDQKPRMSADRVTDAVLKRLADHNDDLLVINYANGDMVGHTGSLPAAIKAVEAVDECVGKVVDGVLAKGGRLIVTADHGNAEQMIDPETGGPHTAHTTFPVELVLVGEALKGRSLRDGGRLADIAPTALDLLGIDIPSAMTGRSLLA